MATRIGLGVRTFEPFVRPLSGLLKAGDETADEGAANFEVAIALLLGVDLGDDVEALEVGGGTDADDGCEGAAKLGALLGNAVADVRGHSCSCWLITASHGAQNL